MILENRYHKVLSEEHAPSVEIKYIGNKYVIFHFSDYKKESCVAIDRIEVRLNQYLEDGKWIVRDNVNQST